jgi:hypothetical protein
MGENMRVVWTSYQCQCNKVGYALFNSWPTRQQWVLQDTSYDLPTNAVPEGQHETVVNTNNMNTRIYSNKPSNIQVWCDRVVPNDVTRAAHINDIEVDVRTRSRARTCQHRHGTPEAYLNHIYKLQPATYRSLTNCVSLRHKQSIHGTWTSFNLHTNLASLDNATLLYLVSELCSSSATTPSCSSIAFEQ